MPEIKVKFSGDTSDLQASSADARRTLDMFAASSGNLKGSIDQLTTSVRQSTAAAAESRTMWGTWAAGLEAEVTAPIRDMVAVWTDELAVLAAVNRGFVEEAQATDRALGRFLDDVAAGFEAIPSKIDAYAKAAAYGTGETRSFINAQDGVLARLGQMVEGAETAMTAMRLYGGAAEQSALTTIALAGNLDAFASEAAKAGMTTTDALGTFMGQIEQIPSTSDAAAASIEGMLGSIPNYTTAANEFLVALLRQISATGDEAVVNARKIAEAFKDVENGGAALGELVNRAPGLRDVQTALAQLSAILPDPGQVRQLYDTILTRQRAIYEAKKASQQAQAVTFAERQRALDLMADESGYLAVATTAEARQLDLAKERNDALKEGIGLLESQKQVYDQMAAVAERQATFDKTLAKANPIDAQLEDLQTRRDVLQGGLDRSNRLAASDTPMSQRTAATAMSAEDITALVRTVIGEAGNQSAQGQLAVAAVALNRLANGNYGDTMSQVVKAGDGTQFNTWKPASKGGSASDQANAPTPVESYQFQRVLQDVVMPLLERQVGDPTKGALNFYNPALTPSRNQFAMSDTTTIGDHLFGTARNAPKAVKPMDADDAAKTVQAIEDADGKIKTLNDKKAGGNALDQAALKIAQRHADGLRDEVGDQEKLVAAARQEVEASKNLAPDAQNAAAKRLAETQATLRDKQVEASIAASKVEAAGMEENSAAQVAVLNGALAQKLALYATDSAAYKGVMAEMIANTKRAGDAQVALARQQGDVARLARGATQGADPIADAQSKVEAARAGLTRTGQTTNLENLVVPGASTGTSTKDQLAAASAYYEALNGLRTANAARQHADDELTVAGTKAGSQERLDAQRAMYAQEIAAAGDDQAKILGIRRQLLEAEQAYSKQQAADSAEKENVAFDAVQRRFTQERAEIEATARAGQVGEAAKASRTIASLDAELAATRAHYAALAQIARDNGTDGPAAQLRLSQQAAIAEDRLQAERVAATRAANSAIAQDYKSAFEQVGETVSSTLMQMIQGQARLRDLVRNVALNIVQQFIQARIHMVADWAAGQVAQVAQTVAAEQAKTAATTAGTAARTGLVGLAAAEQSALVGVGVIKSILASAAETFAGIFGFLSPVMGPAAAGPAIAGQATVAASASLASFDIGSWSLPSSGVAMVHAGEMIVPAAQTPWAQSLLSAGGAGAGGATMGDMHFHIDGARHPGAVVDEIRSNARAISRMLATRKS